MSDVEKLSKLVEDGHSFYYSDKFKGGLVYRAIAEHLLKNDVRIVKHGKWIKVGANDSGQIVISCSNCHCSDYMDVKPNYCWNCGSKNEEIV